jgi:ferredoxin
VVRVIEGSDLLSTMDDEEQQVLLRESAGPEERLACRAYPSASGVILTTGYW